MPDKTPPPCINLKDQFGDRYRISYDPARPKGGKLDPWMMLLTFRGGTVYPYGGELLAVELEGRCYTKAALNRLRCTELIQDGDDFGAFVFDVKHFDQIASIVKPYRRRRLSPEQKQRATERLASYRASTVGV